MEKTPLQILISKLSPEQEGVKLIAESLLPCEKKFASEFWESGSHRAGLRAQYMYFDDEFEDKRKKAFEETPDFETYYKQFEEPKTESNE